MILAVLAAWAARFHDEPAYALAEFHAKYSLDGAQFRVSFYPSTGEAYVALDVQPTTGIQWRIVEPTEASA